MKKLALFLLFLLSIFASAQSTVTVSGDTKTQFGAALSTRVKVCFSITDGNGNQVPDLRVLGTGIVVPTQTQCITPDANGHFTTSFWANDQLSPAGTQTLVEYQYNGSTVHSDTFIFLLADVTENLNSKASNSTPPVVPAPTGDSTYMRLDAGNSPATGLWRFAGGITTTQINDASHLHVDGVKYACNSTGINACLAALPTTGSTPGGVCYVDCPASSSLNLTSTLNVGTALVPMTLVFGGGTPNCMMLSGNCVNVRGHGSAVHGLNKLATDFTCTSGFIGNFFDVQPDTGQVAIDEVVLSDFRVDNTTSCPNNTAFNLLSAGDNVTIHDIEVRGWTGTWLNTGVSSNPGAAVSQGIHVQDVKTQSSGATLTADSVILSGTNQTHIGPNVKVLCPSNCSTVNGIRITVDANGFGGRNDAVFNSSVAGYTTGVLITSASASVPAIANQIGPSNTFENDTLAYKMTGQAGSKAANNFAFFNYFVNTTTNIANLDNATANTILENTNGNPGTITETVNSSGNRFIGNSANGNINNFSDAGNGNNQDVSWNNSGFAERETWGEFIIRRGNTGAQQWKFTDAGTMLNKSSQTVNDGNNPGTETIGSGTATMTTAAINAGVCGTTVTVAATGVVTTDTITWAFNAAPVGNNAGLIAWPTANNVNFAYCPNSAETPTAATINWRVVR